MYPDLKILLFQIYPAVSKTKVDPDYLSRQYISGSVYNGMSS